MIAIEPLTENEARLRLEAAIRAVLETPPGDDPWRRDLQSFLASFTSLGEPRLFHVEGLPARFLTPLKQGERVGALVATDPFTGEVLAWPSWLPGGRPPFSLTEAELLKLAARGDPRVQEVLPAAVDRANRFAVTPEDLRRATLIDGWDRLPYKNQEERYDWVERVNGSGRMRTRWRHAPGVQEPAFKCLSYASSTVADWWGWRLGSPPSGRYQSLVNGLVEYGLNPRELEVLYHHRGRSNPVRYPRLPPVGAGRDPVTRERIPSSMRSYALLLTSPEPQTLKDPLYRVGAPEYTYWPGKYHMDGPPRVLFSSGRQDEAAILEALPKHGIVLAMTQTRLLNTLRIGLHAIAIVGWFEREGRVAFVYHESYGNRAAGYLWDHSGGPGLMSIETRLLRGAVAFPHHAWLDLIDAHRVTVRHGEGGALDAAADVTATAGGTGVGLEAEDSSTCRIPSLPGCSLELRVTHRHFHDRTGRPVTLELPWPGPVERAAALPVLRWLALTRQVASRKPSPEPVWIAPALQECRVAFRKWAARVGEREARKRLGAWRERVLRDLPRAQRDELCRAFPDLR